MRRSKLAGEPVFSPGPGRGSSPLSSTKEIPRSDGVGFFAVRGRSEAECPNGVLTYFVAATAEENTYAAAVRRSSVTLP